MKPDKVNFLNSMAPSGADPIRQSFSEHAETAQVQQRILNQHVENIRSRQMHWLNRMLASPEEKQMLDTFWKRQNEALDQVLSGRNASLKIIGEAQLSFIREVCDSLLISTRSQVQLNRSASYQQRFLELNTQLDTLNDAFFELVSRKMETIAHSSGKLQELHIGQLERMLRQWDQTYAAALDEFAGIILSRRPVKGEDEQ